jgi:hypothetical protein
MVLHMLTYERKISKKTVQQKSMGFCFMKNALLLMVLMFFICQTRRGRCTLVYTIYNVFDNLLVIIIPIPIVQPSADRPFIYRKCFSEVGVQVAYSGSGSFQENCSNPKTAMEAADEERPLIHYLPAQVIFLFVLVLEPLLRLPCVCQLHVHNVKCFFP